MRITRTTQDLLNSIMDQIERLRACDVRPDMVEISTYDYDRIIADARKEDFNSNYFHVRGRPADQIFGVPIVHNSQVTPGVARFIHIAVIDQEAPNE